MKQPRFIKEYANYIIGCNNHIYGILGRADRTPEERQANETARQKANNAVTRILNASEKGQITIDEAMENLNRISNGNY